LGSLEIEHYEPQKYKPERKDDPTNLLLSCRKCNSGKGDYHPDYDGRRRMRSNTDGHSVIDIRKDDFSELYTLRENGELLLNNGKEKERAKFNIVLLRFDTPKIKNRRKRCLEYISGAESLIGVTGKGVEEALKILVGECAKRYLFIQAFDIAVSDDLKELIKAYLKANKPELV
jgi:hypothetical protein